MKREYSFFYEHLITQVLNIPSWPFHCWPSPTSVLCHSPHLSNNICLKLIFFHCAIVSAHNHIQFDKRVGCLNFSIAHKSVYSKGCLCTYEFEGPSNHLLCCFGVIKSSYIWVEQKNYLHGRKNSSRNKNAYTCIYLHSYSHFWARTKIHREMEGDGEGERNKPCEQPLRFYHLIVFSRKCPIWFPKTWNIPVENECLVQLNQAYIKFTVGDLISHNCYEVYISSKQVTLSFWCK